MRVTLLAAAPGVPVRGPSGSSAHLRGLCRALLDLGHDARIVAARLADARGVHGEAVPAVEVGAPGWPSWLDSTRDLAEVWAARRVARRVIEDALRAGPPDLIIERHSLFSDAGWRVHDRLGVPWVLEVNAPLAAERARYEVLRRPAWAARWERDVLRAAPVVVAVSAWLQRWLTEEIGCQRVALVRNGTDGLVGDRARGRALLRASPTEPLVGFVGSLKPWHGFERLTGVARAVGARAVLIGRAAGVQEGPITPGHLGPQALADAIAALDVALAPYPPDAPPWFCPLKVLDYRAQGTPVVATDVGECRALVGDGGAVVPAADDDALIAATRTWLGRRAAPWIRSWRDVAGEVLAVAESRAGG